MGVGQGAALGAAFGELTVKKQGFDRDLDDAERKFSRTASSLERRADKLAKNMRSAWNNMAMATAAMGAAMGAATKMAADLENAMADVQKVTSAKTMEAMKGEIMDMANTIPMATDGLAKIATEAGRAGIQGAEALSRFTEVTAQLGTATVVTAERAAKSLAKVMQWMDIPGKYARNVGAAINKLSNNMVANTDEIMRTLGKTAQQFQLMGAARSTTLALSASVSALADSAERGGTRMRRLLQELREPRKIKGVANALNMTSQSFENLLRRSPIDAIMKMSREMKNSQEVADDLSSTLASTSRVTLDLLSGNLGKVNEALEMAKEQLEDPTSLAREFGIAVATLYSQLKLLSNVVKNLFVRLMGDQTLGVITDLVETTKNWLHALYNVVEANKDVREAITGLLEAGLHIFGVITAFGLLFKAISLVLSPVTLLTMGFIALGAAWRWDAWGLKSFFESNAVKFTKNLADNFEALGKAISELPDIPKSLGTLIKKGIDEPIETGVTLALTIQGISMLFGGSFLYRLIVRGAGTLSSLGLGAVSGTLGWVVGPLMIGLTIEAGIEKFTPVDDLSKLIHKKLDTWFKGVGQAMKDFAKDKWWLSWSVTDKVFVYEVGITVKGIAKDIWNFLSGGGDSNVGEGLNEFTRGTETTLDKNRKALENLVSKYANAPQLIDQEAVNEINTVVQALEKSSDKLTESTKELMRVAKETIIGKSGIEPEKKQKGGPIGMVPGSGNGDIIPAMLEPGEFVWPKEMVKRFPGIIKGMWQGFKKGGPVSSGKHYYGPGPEGNKGGTKWIESAIEKLEERQENVPEDIENVEKFTRDLGYAITTLKALRKIQQEYQALMEKKSEEQKSLTDKVNGLTKATDIASLSLEELGDKIQGMDISQIERLPKALESILYDFTEREMPRGVAIPEGMRTGGTVTTKGKRTDWDIEALSTLKAFDTKLVDLADKLVSLEEVAGKYGRGQEVVSNITDKVRSKFVELTGSSDAFDQALKNARDGGKKTQSALQKLGESLNGVARELFGGFGPLAGEFMDRLSQGKDLFANLAGYIDPFVQVLMSAIKTTDEWERVQSIVKNALESLGGILEPFLQVFGDVLELAGNAVGVIADVVTPVIQAFADAIRWVVNTAISIVNTIPFVSIEKVGKEAEDSEEQLRKFKNVLSSVNSGLESLVNEIGGFLSDLLGPFGRVVDALIGGLFEVSSAIITNLDDPLKAVTGIFDALMGVASGLLNSFFNLIQQSEAYQALQDSLEPIWQTLANQISDFLWVVVAVVEELKDFWGITDNVGEEMEEISDLNVPSGFKRARKVWESATPGEKVTGGGGTGTDIPDWAKSIGEEIAKIINNWLEEDLAGAIKDIFDIPEGTSIWEWFQGEVESFLGLEGDTTLAKKIEKWLPSEEDMVGWADDIESWWNENEDTFNNLVGFIDDVDWDTFASRLNDFIADGLKQLTNLDIPDRLLDGGDGPESDEDDLDIQGWKEELAAEQYAGKIGDFTGKQWENKALQMAQKKLEAGKISLDKIIEALTKVSKMSNAYLQTSSLAGYYKGWKKLQAGGIVTQPVRGIVGEAGPEAVIPLDQFGSLGGSTIEININTSGDGIVDDIIDEVQVKNKRLTGSKSTSAAINRRQYS